MSDTPTTSPDSLPLPFGVPIAADRDSAILPLPFKRRLGDVQDGGEVVPDTDTDYGYNPWRDPVRPMVSASFGFVLHATATRAVVRSGFSNSRPVALDYRGVYLDAVDMAACMQAAVQGMVSLRRGQNSSYSPAVLYAGDAVANISGMADLRRETRPNMSGSASLARCGHQQSGVAVAVRKCGLHQFRPSESKAYSLEVYVAARAAIGACSKSVSLPALAVPCEWYEIPVEPDLPTQPDNTYVCGLRPPSDAMPLRFRRRVVGHSADSIPIPFTCYPELKTPLTRAYMIVNTVSSSFDNNTPLELLSASFTTDMGGYCWQGTVTVPPDDFAKLNMDGRAKGNEAVITVNINGGLFVILAEEYRDNRAFGQKSYTVSGRSVTARLGESYAVQVGGVFDAPIYARQIADTQLKNTGVRLTDWQAADWLIPADVYASTDKTPMMVLQELAQAAGAFVESRPGTPEINIKPRWKKSAWEVAEASPDVAVPASVILNISGNRNVKPLAGGVFVYADHAKGKGADVYRRTGNREPRAAAVTGPLYTDMPVLQAAGVAALSDTGTHKTETVTLPVSDKYALPLAQLGQIWQIQEPTGAWQGVVTGVTMAVDIENDAPRVLQTVVINRYLDD
ncbi:hypothetical protein [Neisseria montereyensis]|uniref:Phage tail protein n=1 Tax=Neisseria montereyensis TaxID=2973938 RepID=A0ABT2FDD9_9NEIS|nr:hypothetical protein [Neisseria montereyensis]MCS4534234.1 hypothetical protein [Neisseria montereyensis]